MYVYCEFIMRERLCWVRVRWRVSFLLANRGRFFSPLCSPLICQQVCSDVWTVAGTFPIITEWLIGFRHEQLQQRNAAVHKLPFGTLTHNVLLQKSHRNRSHQAPMSIKPLNKGVTTVLPINAEHKWSVVQQMQEVDPHALELCPSLVVESLAVPLANTLILIFWEILRRKNSSLWVVLNLCLSWESQLCIKPALSRARVLQNWLLCWI